HADLWALGVSLYEMVGGSPPYHAQDTRKLENLIQSRRPPRALPAGCPDRLKVIIFKALAGDIERRYATAAAFENDLRAFVENRPTAAERENQQSWEANETIEKSAGEPIEPTGNVTLDRARHLWRAAVDGMLPQLHAKLRAKLRGNLGGILATALGGLLG